MNLDKRGKYLLAQDIIDWNEYNDDGSIKYYSQWLDKTGRIFWVDQHTNQIIYVD